MRKILFILNPKAGAGLNNTITESIKKSFNENDFETNIIFTERAGQATELCRQAVENKFDIVAAAGGDGTINETARSLKHSSTALAIIPTGSGNGFARHFNIPVNIEKAIGIIKTGKLIKVDSLLINDKFCINVAGVGFDAYIAHLFANYGRRGFASYVKLVMREYFAYRQKNYVIECDGRTINACAFLIAMANAAQFGNGAKISPFAKTDDEMIDLTILKRIPVHGILRTVIRMFNGTLSNSPYAEMLQGKLITISSVEEVPFHIDGEPIEPSKKIVASVDPLSVKLIAP